MSATDKPDIHLIEDERLDQANNAFTKEQLDREQAQQLATAYVEGSEEEKALVAKLDWRLVVSSERFINTYDHLLTLAKPAAWTLYLLANLDRSNIGNAKSGGLEDDFGFTSTQYSVVVLIFFVSYLIFEIPSNMILHRVRPSLYLPGIAILWGTIATCMGAVQNTNQLVALRFLLGAAEAGFAPGLTFYLSSW